MKLTRTVWWRGPDGRLASALVNVPESPAERLAIVMIKTEQRLRRLERRLGIRGRARP